MCFSLPSIKCSAAPPSFWLCCLNCTRRFYLITARSAVVGSWEEPPNIWLTIARNAFVGWDLNFRVRVLLKSAIITYIDSIKLAITNFQLSLSLFLWSCDVWWLKSSVLERENSWTSSISITSKGSFPIRPLSILQTLLFSLSMKPMGCCFSL